MISGIDQRFLSQIHSTEAKLESLERADRKESFGETLGAAIKEDSDKPVKDTRLWDVCVEFEAIFINQMYTEMRKSVNKEGMIHGGPAEEIFEDFLYDEYAKMTSKHSSMGIASMLYSQLA